MMLCALEPFYLVEATTITMRYEVMRDMAGNFRKDRGWSGLILDGLNHFKPSRTIPDHPLHLKRDPNVHASIVCFVPIVETRMGMHPMKKSEHHLVYVGRPNGGRLLEAPQSERVLRRTGCTIYCALLFTCAKCMIP